MWAHKLLRLMALAAASLALSAVPARGSNPHAHAGAPEPAIAPIDQRFLTQVVRRTLEARLRNEQPYAVSYVPPALSGVTCQVMVTLRESGYARGIGTSALLPAVAAAQEAALVALSSARGGGAELTSLHGLRIEMQALGPVTDYAGSSNWMTPGALVGFLEPGVHGVRLFLDDEGRWFTPGEMISRGMSLEEAVLTLGKEVSLDSRVLNEARLGRFRALHWWEVDDAGQVVTLQRGMVPVAQEDVTRRALDDAIEELITYIIYRQRPDGWFATSYNPASDKYAEENDPGMHAGACWALAEAARRGSRAAAESLERGLRAQQALLVSLGSGGDAAFIATPDQDNPLAVTAEHCLALAVQPDAARQADTRNRLARAMLWLQRADGHFLTVFPPVQDLEPQDRAPGMALAALAECYRLEPAGVIAEAAAKAFTYYRAWFKRTGTLAMIPWHTQAYARMAERMKRDDYAEYVFELSDHVCARQLQPANCVDAVLWGAIATDVLPPGSGTAAFTSGLADAAVLARQRGDEERYKRYVAACRLGARFILQLQFKPEECYYVRSPHDAVGGIRISPTNPRVHLDSCQHALLALIKCRELLYPDQP